MGHHAIHLHCLGVKHHFWGINLIQDVIFTIQGWNVIYNHTLFHTRQYFLIACEAYESWYNLYTLHLRNFGPIIFKTKLLQHALAWASLTNRYGLLRQVIHDESHSLPHPRRISSQCVRRSVPLVNIWM